MADDHVTQGEHGAPPSLAERTATAERMLRAARAMRAAHGADHPRHAFWFALSDWLDWRAGLAAHWDTAGGYDEQLALAICEEYLTGASQ